jgi:hypothetical protein
VVAVAVLAQQVETDQLMTAALAAQVQHHLSLAHL